MWNGGRRQEELKAKLDEQTTLITQLQATIHELQRATEDQATRYLATQTEQAQQITALQGTIETTTGAHAAHDSELKDVIKGLERGIKDTNSWHTLPSDAAFWTTADEARRPFVIPFTPDMDLMLWIAHARFPTQPETSLVLPRSYAQRAFVRVPESKDGATSQAIPIRDADPDKQADLDKLLPDGYIALRLKGYAAPPSWIDALIALKQQEDLNMWLVWFIEDQSNPANAHIRVAVACPMHTFTPEPKLPAEWVGEHVIYFEPHPSKYMRVSLPETPVIATYADTPGSDAPSDQPSAM